MARQLHRCSRLVGGVEEHQECWTGFFRKHILLVFGSLVAPRLGEEEEEDEERRHAQASLGRGSGFFSRDQDLSV